MTRASRSLLAAVVLLTVPALTARARTFSLNQAVRFALRHSSLTALARARTLMADARLRAARAQGMPQISATYNYLFSDNPLAALTAELERRQVTASAFTPANLNHPGISRLATAGLSLTVPLYSGGAISADIRAGRLGRAAAQAGRAEIQQRIMATTVQAYEGVLAAKAAVHIAREAMRAARKHADTTARLYHEGRIVHADALTAAVYLRATHEGVLKAEAALQAAQANLVAVLGAPAPLSVQLPAIHLQPPAPVTMTAQAAIARALQQRPDIRALEAERAADLAEARALRARSGIQVGVTASTDWYSETPLPRHNAWTVAGTISAPLYTGGRARDQAAVKQGAALEVAARVDELRTQIRLQIMRTYSNMQIAWRRYRLAVTNVTEARAAVRLIRIRYGEGRTILLDLLNAEEALTAAREQRLAAVYALVSDEANLAAADASLSPQTLPRLSP
ncbi:MAG: TolC family protein [Gammaproteobacteria bacterium]|nr:TolC family protein [Gammaproteobacteria bacterium]